MYATWFIALVVSGGGAGWAYQKLLRNNGNQRDTMIAAGVIWFLGFIILGMILRSLGV